jgi:hypothetical protein
VSDEKVFPKPRPSSGYREPSTPSDPAIRIAAPRKQTVVTLADPPHDENEHDENPAAQKPKLSPDEIKALLAVDKSANVERFSKTKNRLVFAAFPTFFVSIAADKLFGWWGIPVTLACSALWALWPMRKQDREGW